MLATILLLVVAAAPCPASQHEGTWSYVVMGDTRDTTTDTLTGISPDLGRLAAAIAAEKPDLVIHTGDLANGYYTTPTSPMHGRFHDQFRNWKKGVKALYDYDNKKGVFIYFVRGNHEDGKYVTDENLKRAYEDEFARLMPQNGPEHEKGLTYSFSHKGARFFAFDAYHKKKAEVIRGYVNLGWLDENLAKEKRPFTFAFSHTPAYKVGDYHESPFPDLYSHPAARDQLWGSLLKGGTAAYFCGHIHFYCRGTVAGIEQIVVGDGGADTVAFDPKAVDSRITMHYPSGPMAASDVETGYLLIVVNEKTGTLTGTQKLWNKKTGNWEKGDVFTLKARQ